MRESIDGPAQLANLLVLGRILDRKRDVAERFDDRTYSRQTLSDLIIAARHDQDGSKSIRLRRV